VRHWQSEAQVQLEQELPHQLQGFGLATLGSLQQEVRWRQEEPHEAHPCFAKIRRQEVPDSQICGRL
jgi:hypothetical protein